MVLQGVINGFICLDIYFKCGLKVFTILTLLIYIVTTSLHAYFCRNCMVSFLYNLKNEYFLHRATNIHNIFISLSTKTLYKISFKTTIYCQDHEWYERYESIDIKVYYLLAFVPNVAKEML